MAEQIENEKHNVTVFGTETEFDGVLEFKDKLVITGKFTGEIKAPTGDIEIARNAVCEVKKMEANSIVISGTLKGDMHASERVEICSGSKVDSNITTARFRIANNVEYNGQVSMLEEDPDVDLFSVASKEFKKAMAVKSNIIK